MFKKLRFQFLLAILSIHAYFPAVAFDAKTDSLALVALYNSTGGNNWTNKTNWLTGNIYTWYGLTFIGDRVKEISLFNNNLTGNLPPEIGNLSELQSLMLTDNKLSGAIPGQIKNLTSLKFLSLTYNKLTGTIPVEITEINSLEKLLLAGNQLTGTIPPELSNLTSLKELWLNSNQLSGSIPTELGKVTSLESLLLSELHLSGSIPPEIGNLRSLRTLWLSYNQLSGTIPSSLGNLQLLDQLLLGSNNLTGDIPSELGNLSQISEFDISNNNLTGVIPSEFSNCSLLSRFYIHNNKIVDLPNLLNAPLTYASVGFNNFTFEDIEPNISKLNFYAPQANFGDTTYIYFPSGGTTVLNYPDPIGGTANHYQWYKDDILLTNEIGSTLTLSNISNNDYGKYHLVVYNTLIPQLTLTGNPIYINSTINTGIHNSNEHKINFYPNPTFGVLNIESTSIPDHSSIEIFNHQGEKILDLSLEGKISAQKFSGDFSHINPGKYIIYLKDKDENILDSFHFVKY